jgi:hypothetical protein
MTTRTQVDDSGENYWIFESRDVGGPVFQLSLLRTKHSPPSLHGLPILSTLGECLDMRFRLSIRNSCYP